MALALPVLGGLIDAAFAAVLAHRLTSRRDQENRRSDLRVEYLLRAYRTLADTAHRDLDPITAQVHAFEQGLADIQLLGSREQAAMAIFVSKGLADSGSANLDGLLLSLRDDCATNSSSNPCARLPSISESLVTGARGQSDQ